MPVPIIAAGVGGLLAGGGAAVAAGVGGNAAQSAADTTAQVTREGIASQEKLAKEGQAFLEKQYGIARKDYEPFRQSQLNAINALTGLSDPSNPMWGAQRDEMTKSLQRQLAAQGLLRSTNQTDGLAQIELGLYAQRMGILGGLAGTGAGNTYASMPMQLGSTVAGMQTGLGQGIGSSLAGLGQSMGAAKIAQGNAIAGGITGAANALGAGFGSAMNYYQNQPMNDLIMRLLQQRLPDGLHPIPVDPESMPNWGGVA